MISAVALALVLAVPAVGWSPEQFLADARERGRAVTAYLATEAAWSPEQKDRLLNNLRLVGLVRPREAMPILVTHLGYRDTVYDKQEQTKQVPPELQYPVYGALKQYGAPAIPPLMSRIKRPEPMADDIATARELYLSSLLLINLSDDPKIGTLAARARVQNELDRYHDSEFPRLRAILRCPMLR